MSAVLAFRDVRRAFGAAAVLDGANLELRKGEIVSIVGPSGAGKTTVLNLASGLDRAYSGKIEVFGHALEALDDDARTTLRGRSMGFVFQSFQLLEHLSVGENVRLPLWLQAERRSDDEERRRALAALESVGLAARIDAPVGPLSGGERQRVAIARAIIHEPALLLADEPTGNLDAETAASIYAVFDGLRSSSRAVLIATHDKALAARADRVLKLERGQLVEGAR